MRSYMLPSLLRGRNCLRWKVPWCPQYHVVRSTSLSTYGCFYSTALIQAGGVFGAQSTERASRVPQGNSSTKCLMITSLTPSTVKYQDVIKQLSKFLGRSNAQVRAAKSPAVIILATPTFATWLDNEPFISVLLEKFFITNGSGATNNLRSTITVLVAVVDGLPPENPKAPGNSLQVTEGFAFLLCDQELALPRLWEQDNINGFDDGGYGQRPSILFRMSSNSSPQEWLDIGLPLANTMFRNGRTSTLIASSWRRTNGSSNFEKIKQVERKSVTIYPASANSMIPLRLEIPLVPLAPFRRVVSGLGNILRQVTDAHGSAVSASLELEASIDAYLDARDLQKRAVTVWALIVPNAEMVDRNEKVPGNDQERIRASWTNTAAQDLLPYVGSWIKSGWGGTLHRVLSGGGGWGLKQGLLSLDPDTSLQNFADARYDFDSSDPGDNEHIQALGNIAKPGSWVQFLISHQPNPKSSRATVALGDSNADFKLINCLSLGCIPSTVDDMPQSLSNPLISMDENDFQSSVDGLEGHFGAMSEKGIFIRVKGDGAVASSKIDVPYSIYQWGMVNG